MNPYTRPRSRNRAPQPEPPTGPQLTTPLAIVVGSVLIAVAILATVAIDRGPVMTLETSSASVGAPILSQEEVARQFLAGVKKQMQWDLDHDRQSYISETNNEPIGDVSVDEVRFSSNGQRALVFYTITSKSGKSYPFESEFEADDYGVLRGFADLNSYQYKISMR